MKLVQKTAAQALGQQVEGGARDGRPQLRGMLRRSNKQMRKVIATKLQTPNPTATCSADMTSTCGAAHASNGGDCDVSDTRPLPISAFFSVRASLAACESLMDECEDLSLFDQLSPAQRGAAAQKGIKI